MKKHWFIPLVLVIVLSIGAIGANAYFSSTARSITNQFTSGTLILTLSNDDVTFGNPITGTWVTPTNWAPGDKIKAKLYLKNEGTIDAQIVDANWILGGDTMLGDKVIISDFTDYTGGPMGGVIGWTINHLAGVSATNDGWFSNSAGPFIPAGQSVWFEMEFTFDPTAGNEYQGKTLYMDVVLTAQQVNTH